MLNDTSDLNVQDTSDDSSEAQIFSLFTNRAQEIRLFKLLCERCVLDQPRPIVNFIAPAGTGKSTLIDYLRKEECRKFSIPQIRIDFSHTNAPRDDLLLMLVKIRNKLREREDESGRHLEFPRFDFGAALALARLKREEYPDLSGEDEIRDALRRERSRLDEWIESARDLGNIVSLVPAVVAAANLVGQIEALDTFWHWLQERDIWEWYRERAQLLNRAVGTEFKQGIKQIIQELYQMSAPDEPDRAIVIEQILAEALLADVREAFMDRSSGRIWPTAQFAVLFFYGFDALLGDAADIGLRLLKALTLTEQGTYKEYNPLLLVAASQRPIIAHQQDEIAEPVVNEEANEFIYNAWYGQFVTHRSNLDLEHLVLPFVMQDFDSNSTLRFLRKFGRRYGTTAFEDDVLGRQIFEVTRGHPFSLSLVATAIHRTWPNARKGQVDLRLRELVVDGKNVAESMLQVFLSQLSGLDRRQLIWSAFPREIDKEILRETLQLPDDVTAQEKWEDYKHLPFVRWHRDRLVLHPLARDLLLQELPPSRENRNYFQIHTHLQTYFHNVYVRCPENEGARIEEAYHALASGNPQPAIEMGCQVYKQNRPLWQQLMDAVAQVPVGSVKLKSAEVEKKAQKALSEARQSSSDEEKLKESIKAIILYRWLLTASGLEKHVQAQLWKKLGEAFASLPGGDPQEAFQAKDRAIQIMDEVIRPYLHDEEVGGPVVVQSPNAGRGTTANSQGGSDSTTDTTGGGTSSTTGQTQSTQSSQTASLSAGKGSLQGGRNDWRNMLRSLLRPARNLLVAPWMRALIVIICVMLAVGLLAPTSLLSRFPLRISPAPPAVNVQAHAQDFYPPDARGIGEVAVANGSENVGVSDGSVAFDINGRADGYDKTQAALAFRQHRLDDPRGGNGARQWWLRALAQEPDDAEAQIYLENLRLAGKCVYFVVATDLSDDMPENLATGRDYLQGAYIAQKEYNNQSYSGVKVCLLVANVGSKPSYADSVVAPQIVKVAQQMHIKGVMGWPGLLAGSMAVSLLNQAEIPIVSPARYDALDTASNLFHSIPSNETEGMLDAIYAEQQLHAHKILLLYNLDDSFSMGLSSGFMQQLRSDGASNLLVASLAYASCSGQNATGNCLSMLFAPLVQEARQVQPDLIFFTGNAAAGQELLDSLTRAGLASAPAVLGRDDLYQLAETGYPAYQSPYLRHLVFTSFAYYGEKSVTTMVQDYAASFDAGDTLSPPRAYGYTIPDNTVIFAYNATRAVIASIAILPSPSTPFSPGEALQALEQEQVQIIGMQQPELLTFTSLHEPGSATLIALKMDDNGAIQMLPDSIHS